MRIAAMDLGTNSFLCLIADFEGGELKTVVHDRVEIVRLGQGVAQSGQFHKEALQRADACLKSFSEDIKKLAAERVFAVATSAARDVSNAEEFASILEKYEIPLEIISGQREAELTFIGATDHLSDKKNVAVIDVGGGSTEIILQSNFGGFFSQSLQLGGVRSTEKWITKHPISAQEREKMKEDIREKIGDFYVDVIQSRSIEVSELIGVAGTPTTLAAMTLGEEFSVERVQNFRLYRGVLEEWVDKLSQMNIEERCQLVGLERGRADIIVAGALILLECLNSFGLDSLTVSTKGVRYGLALKGVESIHADE